MSSYNEYKDSGLPWFSKVPSSWSQTRNKYIFRSEKRLVGTEWESYQLLTMGKGGVNHRYMEDGGKFPESFESYQVVKPNQIIFCLFDIDETPRTVGLSKHDGMITSAYDVFSCSEDCDPRFINYYYLSIDDIKGLKPFYTGLRKVVRSDTFMSIPIYLPDLEEQKKISDFLDSKLSEIESLIEQIELKIKLLEEQKVSLIDEMIVKRYSLDVPLKSSEIEWIGSIPETWSVKKLKFISSIGLSSVDRTVSEVENQVSICHYPQVYNNEKITEQTELSVGSCTDLELKNYVVLKNDILITKDSESSDDIGIPSFIDAELENTVCGYTFHKLESRKINVFQSLSLDLSSLKELEITS